LPVLGLYPVATASINGGRCGEPSKSS
jgi:hypothetical protein